MNPSDKPRFWQEFCQTYEAIGKPPKKEIAELVYNDLADLEIDVVVAAFRTHRNDAAVGMFAPMAAHIRAQVEKAKIRSNAKALAAPCHTLYERLPMLEDKEATQRAREACEKALAPYLARGKAQREKTAQQAVENMQPKDLTPEQIRVQEQAIERMKKMVRDYGKVKQ